MSEFLAPAAAIMAVLDEIGARFPDGAVGNVRELVEHDEPGVALGVLCSQILEYGIELSPENKFRLTNAAGLMGITLSELDGLAG
jgi:hypothetical protein